MIDAHILFFKARAGYGEKVIPQLARAINANDRVLYRCLRFFREYPILTRGSELGWSHYRVLLDVPDKTQRKTLELSARKNDWTAPELERRVRALNAIDVTPAAPLTGGASTRAKLHTPEHGTPGVCRVIADGEDLAVDLGFACYLRPPAASGLKANDFAKVTKAGVTRLADATKADLFTYRAEILKVVDGDTLWVRIFLRPDQWVKQKLRLRDLDCPEIDTPAGKAAKRFTESLVNSARSVTISTTKPDKYDRYLADVFIRTSTGDAIFLNNALLEACHAVTKKAWEFGDWELEG